MAQPAGTAQISLCSPLGLPAPWKRAGLFLAASLPLLSLLLPTHSFLNSFTPLIFPMPASLPAGFRAPAAMLELGRTKQSSLPAPSPHLHCSKWQRPKSIPSQADTSTLPNISGLNQVIFVLWTSFVCQLPAEPLLRAPAFLQGLWVKIHIAHQHKTSIWE